MRRHQIPNATLSKGVTITVNEDSSDTMHNSGNFKPGNWCPGSTTRGIGKYGVRIKRIFPYPGPAIFQGDYTQTQNGQLDIKIGSDTAYNTLRVKRHTKSDGTRVRGNAQLDGTLRVAFLNNGFVPHRGSSFTILRAQHKVA